MAESFILSHFQSEVRKADAGLTSAVLKQTLGRDAVNAFRRDIHHLVETTS